MWQQFPSTNVSPIVPQYKTIRRPLNRLPFEAMGRGVIDWTCTNTGCSASFEIQGTLSKPISLTSTRPPPPEGIFTTGCHSASESPTWTLKDVKHSQSMSRIYSAFTGALISRSGYLDLDIYNHANKVTIPCRLVGEGLTNYTDSANQLPNYNLWWTCDAIDQHLFPKYNISTLVMFNKTAGTLGVNQTWYCSDDEGLKP